jgi:hypothetical protein
MTPEEEIRLLLSSALPIDNVDQFLFPGLNIAIIWVDLSDRPDLMILAEHNTINEDGYSICSYFYTNPGRRNMQIGLRVEMRQPVRFVFPLVFQVARNFEQLTTISLDGSFWVLPGPRLDSFQKMLKGRDIQGFINRVSSVCGQGLFITLEEHLVIELRKQLAAWKHNLL